MTYIPDTLRHLVEQRANSCCEYCLLHSDDNGFPHEVDHVIAEKHRGETIERNMCFCCLECNRHKGSDLASLDPLDDVLTPLFNPRTQNWNDHFRLEGHTSFHLPL